MKLLLLLAFLVAPHAYAQEEEMPLPDPAEMIPRSATSKPPAPKPSVNSEPSRAVKAPWYRNTGEYISTRSTRLGQPTEPNATLTTDGKRIDATVGKRIPLYTWANDALNDGWTIGIDAGMLASLQRFQRNGRLTFATNSFDGFFGAFVGFASEGWIALFRTAHLSAHLVDNHPQILTPAAYSQFWNELIVGYSFVDPAKPNDWDLYLQGSVGLNNTSVPVAEQPRATLGLSVGHALSGPDSPAIVASADATRAGVENQENSYTFFLGLGTLNRPEQTHRPIRLGVVHFTGSDYRNQFYNQKQNWTAFQASAEF
jgi:hypothetical protein